MERLCFRVIPIPADTWRLYNVASTSMQRHDVPLTLRRRCIDVMCPPGIIRLSQALPVLSVVYYKAYWMVFYFFFVLCFLIFLYFFFFFFNLYWIVYTYSMRTAVLCPLSLDVYYVFMLHAVKCFVALHRFTKIKALQGLCCCIVT